MDPPGRGIIQGLLSKLAEWGQGGNVVVEWREEDLRGDMKDQEDGIKKKKIESKGKERDILKKGAIEGLGRNQVLGKFAGHHSTDPC